MKKLFITLVASALVSVGAFAQTSTTTASATKKTDMKDLRKEIRSERKAERLRKHDLKHGEKLKAEAETKIIEADKLAIAKNVKALRADGVKHPLRHAEREMHRHNAQHRHH